jgi:hypothetical protein
VTIGLVVGAGVGVLLQALEADLEPALVAAAVAIVYRVVAAIAYRDRPLVRVMAEEVPAAELRYVVPFEARSRYVGADYVERLAKVRGGTFRRNPTDVGILASLDSLNGPSFDAGRVHPLIREFYEHTSRFKLSIVPEWRRWMKPGDELFKLLVAQPLGQAAIPSNIEEAQRGMISTIDTIAVDGSEEIDIRGWIRTFADSGKPIYVGIYTSFRHEGRGYVSVGFPIPSANFTATLFPQNDGEHDLVLTSRTELAFPGHYLSSVDSERNALTVLKLLYFQECIFVYVAEGELKTEHSFYLAGQRFLTLHYEIERAPRPAGLRARAGARPPGVSCDRAGGIGFRPRRPSVCCVAQPRFRREWREIRPALGQSGGFNSHEGRLRKRIRFACHPVSPGGLRGLDRGARPRPLAPPDRARPLRPPASLAGATPPCPRPDFRASPGRPQRPERPRNDGGRPALAALHVSVRD